MLYGQCIDMHGRMQCQVGCHKLCTSAASGPSNLDTRYARRMNFPQHSCVQLVMSPSSLQNLMEPLVTRSVMPIHNQIVGLCQALTTFINSC